MNHTNTMWGIRSRIPTLRFHLYKAQKQTTQIYMLQVRVRIYPRGSPKQEGLLGVLITLCFSSWVLVTQVGSLYEHSFRS